MTKTSRFQVFPSFFFAALLCVPVLLVADSYIRIVEVSYVGGDVFVTQGSSTKPVKVKNYLPLEHDAVVETENGVVEISFEDELVARVAEDSRLHLSELVLRDDGSRFTRLTLRQGTATFSARLKKNDTFEVVTPYFTVRSPRKSDFRVDLTAQGGRVKVLSGKVEIETPEDVLQLSKGRQLEWDASNAQVALGPAGNKDGWDEWVEERGDAVKSARRARRWSDVAVNVSYNRHSHIGHTHAWGYCPYYGYRPGYYASYSYYSPYSSYWGFGFGYPYYSFGYYSSAYYPHFANGYWPYYFGNRVRHRHRHRRRARHRRRSHGDHTDRAGSGSGASSDSDRATDDSDRRRRGDRADRGDRTGRRASEDRRRIARDRSRSRPPVRVNEDLERSRGNNPRERTRTRDRNRNRDDARRGNNGGTNTRRGPTRSLSDSPSGKGAYRFDRETTRRGLARRSLQRTRPQASSGSNARPSRRPSAARRAPSRARSSSPVARRARSRPSSSPRARSAPSRSRPAASRPSRSSSPRRTSARPSRSSRPSAQPSRSRSSAGRSSQPRRASSGRSSSRPSSRSSSRPSRSSARGSSRRRN